MDQFNKLPEFSRYVAQSQVGQGAFGTVYLGAKKSKEDYLAERKEARMKRAQRESNKPNTATDKTPDSEKKPEPTAGGGVNTEMPEGGLAQTADHSKTPQPRSATGSPKMKETTSSNSNTTLGDGMDTPIHSTGSEEKVEEKVPGANDEAEYDDEPERVAIKVIPNYNRNEDFARRVWLELAILHAGQDIPQIVPMYHIDRTVTYVDEIIVSTPVNSAATAGGGGGDTNPQSPTTTTEVRRIPQYSLHVTMDYVPYDLASLITKRAINSEHKIRSVICQLLLGINALAERNCVHRDLSSRNVLVTNELSAFICDFGLARLYDPDEQMSYGVITQWYRAPEVLLDCKYNSQVDVWAVGVMLAELFLQSHLFMGRNKDVVHQLNCILEFCGFTQTERPWLEGEGPLASCSANAKAYMMKQRITGKGVDTKTFPVDISDSAKDLITRLLQLNPKTRLTAKEALHHHWFQSEPEIKNYIDQQLDYQKTVEIPFTMVGDNIQGYNNRINEVLTLYEEE